jgi:hypothetical protein
LKYFKLLSAVHCKCLTTPSAVHTIHYLRLFFINVNKTGLLFLLQAEGKSNSIAEPPFDRATPSVGVLVGIFLALGDRSLCQNIFDISTGTNTRSRIFTLLMAVDQKHLKSFEMWCWRRMENMSWTDHVRNEGVLLRGSEQRNILHEIRKRKANWVGHILRRNCLQKEVIEGKIKGRIEVTRRRGRRSKQLLDDLGDRRGYSHLKEEALDRVKWRNRFGRGCGPVV